MISLAWDVACKSSYFPNIIHSLWKMNILYIYISYSGVCVFVCVSQDILSFNITVEPVAVMAGSLCGQQGGGQQGGKPENF
jgi:hypothetical protein